MKSLIQLSLFTNHFKWMEFQFGRAQKDLSDMNSLVVQWLTGCSFTAEGAGSIRCWGTKIPQCSTHSQKKINKTWMTIAIVLPLESGSSEIFYELPLQLKDWMEKRRAFWREGATWSIFLEMKAYQWWYILEYWVVMRQEVWPEKAGNYEEPSVLSQGHIIFNIDDKDHWTVFKAGMSSHLIGNYWEFEIMLCREDQRQARKLI